MVRRLCLNCRKKAAPSETDKRWLKSFKYTAPKTTWTGSGCAQCHETGYHGRIGVFEIWRRNENEIDAIIGGMPESELRRKLRQRGCRSFVEDGLEKAQAGIASLSDIRALGQRLMFEQAAQSPKTAAKRSRKTPPSKTTRNLPR